MRPASRIFAALRREASEAPLAVIRNLPGASGRALRAAYWQRRLGSLGARVVIGRNVEIVNPEWVELGDDCWIDDNVSLIAGPPGTGRLQSVVGPQLVDAGRLIIRDRVHVSVGAVIQAHGGVRVGCDTTIAAGARLYSLSHHHRNPSAPEDETLYLFGSRAPTHLQSMILGNILIADGAAVGMNSVVLPGAVLSPYSWLGALSVLRAGVTPERVILQGTPATVVRRRVAEA